MCNHLVSKSAQLSSRGLLTTLQHVGKVLTQLPIPAYKVQADAYKRKQVQADDHTNTSRQLPQAAPQANQDVVTVASRQQCNLHAHLLITTHNLQLIVLSTVHPCIT